MADPLDRARALHGHLVKSHLDGGALTGPDYGIRLNYRVGRFVKSYLRALPWRDRLYYVQAQGYWTLDNWRLLAATGEERFGAFAEACSRELIRRQRDDGSWDYPHPGWKGRVATAEGTWGALGLLETYERTRDGAALEAALRWHSYLEQRVGWQPAGDGVAVNYFGDRTGSAVPNNSVLVLRFLAALAAATGDELPLERAPEILAFLASVQRPSGELPYSVGSAGRPHFQCYQYNAFQALDLIAYRAAAGDAGADPVIAGLARFVADGQRPDGGVPYACDRGHPEVPYHLGATAAALHQAGLAESAARGYERLLTLQLKDGGFPHSLGDYRLLSDRRSYPRSQAMILNHLLIGAAR